MRSLKGQTAWVIGGAGLIGRGIAHGLLRAGATVIVNSRHANRLTSLAEELGHPEKLVTINGSMMEGDAERTAAEALGVTGGMLSHVVAHSGVAWWSRESRDESSTLAAKALLSLSADEFATHAAQLPALHFSAMRTLLPRIHPAEGGASTYTFVTGGTDGAAGSYVAPLAQLNAHAVRPRGGGARRAHQFAAQGGGTPRQPRHQPARRRARRKPARAPALARHWRHRRWRCRRPRAQGSLLELLSGAQHQR